MTQSPGGTFVTVLYDLFEKSGETYVPVQTTADKELEAALRAVDAVQRVEQVSEPEQQADILHEYVLYVPYDFPILDHSVDFATRGDSKYDPITKTWIQLLSGASIVYAVPRTGEASADARLFLCVSTKGSTGEMAKAAAAARAGA